VSFNRYCFMLVLLAFSLLFTLGPFVWYVVGESMSPSTRPTGFVPFGLSQSLEPLIALGLILRKDIACYWGMRWYLVKVVAVVGMAVGVAIGGGSHAQVAAFAPGAVLWAGLAFFLWWNQEYFD
jgi:hypothetical protein